MARLLLQGWGKVRQGESQQQAQGGPRLRRPAGAGPVLKENGGGGLLQAVSRAPGSSLPSDPISPGTLAQAAPSAHLPHEWGVHHSFPPASGQCIYLPSGCLCLDARPPASPSKPPVSSCREVGRQLLPAPLGEGHVRWTWGAEPDEAAGLGFTFGRMDCIFRVTDGVRI